MLLHQADDVLRARHWTVDAFDRRQLARFVRLLALFGVLYGAVMGSYSGFVGDVRFLQMLYSGLKVPLLLGVTFALSLPNFFVVNSLFGLRDDFARSVRALFAAQTAMVIILASLAPLTLFWYASVTEYASAILFNAAMFGTASVAAQIVLRKHYQPLIARDPRHRPLLRAWLIIYTFVGIQMGWVLRPFIGSPDAATTFFREGAWGNAYVVLADTITRAFGT